MSRQFRNFVRGIEEVKRRKSDARPSSDEDLGSVVLTDDEIDELEMVVGGLDGAPVVNRSRQRTAEEQDAFDELLRAVPEVGR